MNIFKKAYYLVRYFPEVSGFVKQELKRDKQQTRLKSINFDEKKLDEFLQNEKELSDIYFKSLLYVGSISIVVFGFYSQLKDISPFLALGFILVVYFATSNLFKSLKDIRYIRSLKREILLNELGVKNSLEIWEILKEKYRDILAKKE